MNIFSNRKIILPRKTNVGTRILDARMGAFDNSTVKTFRAIIEVAADGFDAVRPIFGNGSSSVTYTVASCNLRALANLTDALPAPTSATLPSSGVVPVSASSTRRNYLVGDWINLNSVPRTDGGSGALVCIDAYVSTAASITILGNGSNDNYLGWATRANRKWIMRHNVGDCVTTPANFTDTTNRIQSPIVGLQYAARGRVITVMGIGDSITCGRGTIIGEGFGVLACEAAEKNNNSYFEWVGSGWAGVVVGSYQNYLQDIITAGIKPDIVIFPNTTPNSLSNTITAADINSAKVATAMLLRVAGDNQIEPIVWTVLPTNPSVRDFNATDSLRVAFNTLTLSYRGVNVLDFSKALSGVIDGDGQVNMLVGATTDNIHPNDVGNLILTRLLQKQLVNYS